MKKLFVLFTLVVLTVKVAAQPTYQQALENELYAQRVQLANYQQQLDNALYAQRVMANTYYGYGYRPVVVAPVVPVRVAGPVTAIANTVTSAINLVTVSKLAKAEKKAAEAALNTVNNVPQQPVRVVEVETLKVNTMEVKSMSVEQLSKMLGK